MCNHKIVLPYSHIIVVKSFNRVTVKLYIRINDYTNSPIHLLTH
ncbi:hypothetical protein E27107_300008 [Elizabethkingia anophelis]|nr:hypothetical protein E18064_60141 [Elizabethkingia anophelis]CDN78415.1 hypothetical protein E27107_300008 [Elizabethkingia anophelis]